MFLRQFVSLLYLWHSSWSEWPLAIDDKIWQHTDIQAVVAFQFGQSYRDADRNVIV